MCGCGGGGVGGDRQVGGCIGRGAIDKWVGVEGAMTCVTSDMWVAVEGMADRWGGVGWLVGWRRAVDK